MKVCAVIVTYNRLELLKLTIEKLQGQTRKLDGIIIINNNSNDGTKEYLEKIDGFDIVNLDKNVGGAGGFNIGIKEAYKKEYDYIWIMDDDTICTETALEKMLEKLNVIDGKVGFLSSNVLYKDSMPCLMNIPVLEDVWSKYSELGLLDLKAASFVSVLISKEAVKEVGLPISDFFIWGDDYEYTTRISKKFKSYFVCDSIVYHYMNENKGVDIITTPKERIGRYYYEFRNKKYIQNIDGIKGKFAYYKYMFKMVIKLLLSDSDAKMKKISVIFKGWSHGLRFNPSIEYVNGEK